MVHQDPGSNEYVNVMAPEHEGQAAAPSQGHTLQREDDGHPPLQQDPQVGQAIIGEGSEIHAEPEGDNSGEEPDFGMPGSMPGSFDFSDINNPHAAPHSWGDIFKKLNFS